VPQAQAEPTASAQPKPGRRASGPFDVTSPDRPGDASGVGALSRAAAAERAKACSVPNDPEGRPGALWARDRDRAAALSRRHQGSDMGWRPGAKWAKAEPAAGIAELPPHQRPSMREMGRRSEPASHPFHAMRPDEAGAPRDRIGGAVRPVRTSGEGQREGPYPGPGAFFLTGRMSGGIVGRACAEAPAGARRVAHRPVEPPAVTAHRVGGRDLVHAANAGAAALGIAPGMWLTQARVMAAGLVVLPADPEGDRAAMTRLAMAIARSWAPCVALSDETGLFIDLTGVAHLHGGEDGFSRRLHRVLNRLGFRNRIAVADTPGAAWALARRRCDPDRPLLLCAPDDQREALASLPVDALRLEAAPIRLLDRLGVDTVGELARLPRKPLMRRFGGALIRRLDQATGAAPEPLEPVTPPERIVVERRFFEPIATAGAIERCLQDLCPGLGMALAEAGLGARGVLLVAERVDGRAQTLRVGFARPNRDPAHLLRLLRRRIEEIDPGFGVDALSLHVIRADLLGPEALGPALAELGAPDLAPLVDLLANRLDGRAPWRVRPVESDVPERSVATVPALDPPARDAPALRPDDVRRLAGEADDHPWHPRWPRPVRLLPRPEPVEHVMAELPDQPPRRFTWRGVSHRVVRADGPERITGEWWRRSAEAHAVRDYFQVEDEEGRRFWLFRRGDGVRAETGDLSWHLHGAYA
jgi:protein ImuB